MRKFEKNSKQKGYSFRPFYPNEEQDIKDLEEMFTVRTLDKTV